MSAEHAPIASTAPQREPVRGGFAELFGPGLQAMDPSDWAATPRLVAAWARAISGAWSQWAAQGQVDASQPLYIVDLEPGEGRLAVRLARAIALLQHHRRWCYVACADADHAHRLMQVPELEELAACGLFDTAHWAEATSGRLLLRHQRTVAQGHANPVVAVALGAWARSAPQLWGVHHEQRFTATMVCTPDPDTEGEFSIATEWQPSAMPAPALVEPLLAHYQHRITSAAVTIPLAALQAIQALHAFSRGQNLLLSADRAIVSELQLRLGAAWPPRHTRNLGAGLPLNLHALRLHCEAHGSLVWDRQLRDCGWAVQACLEDKGSDIERRALLARVAAALEDGHPEDDRVHESMATGSASLAEALGILRASLYPPRVAAPLRELVWAPTERLGPTQRPVWKEAMHRSAAQLLSQDAGTGLHLHFSQAALALGCWPQARRALHDAAAIDATQAAIGLATVCAATGQVEDAIALLRQPPLQEEPTASKLRRRLVQRVRRWRTLPWCGPRLPREGELTLEPVGREHVPALVARYRDPQIGLLTGLPALTDENQATAWLDELGATDGAYDFAVMHRDEGFIGMISGRRMGHVASFHFWIGAELQGQGYGPRAARLAFAHLRTLGVREVVTTVLQSNPRSRAAMLRLGMHALPLRPLPPDESLLTFGMRLDGAPHDPAGLSVALARLYEAVGSPVKFAPVGGPAGERADLDIPQPLAA